LVNLPLVQLWNRRSLLLYFSVLNIKMRFQSTYLGIFWAAIEPLLYFTVLYIVFTNIRESPENFGIYLITGVILFQIFIRGTGGGLGSIRGSGGIIKSMNIRLEFFPVVATVAIGLLAIVDVGVFLGLMPVFQFVPTWTIVLFPLVLFLLLILILGLSYFLSIVSVFLRDIQNIWTIFSHTLLFISPVFWYINETNGILMAIHQINPLGQLIEIAHQLVIDGQIPPLSEWLYTTLFVFAIFFSGYFVLRVFENKVMEEL